MTSIGNGGLYDSVLRQVEAALGRTFHDINNPLSIISGNVQLLEQLLVMADPDPDVMAVVDDIRLACEKMDDATKQIDDLRSQVKAVRSGEGQELN